MIDIEAIKERHGDIQIGQQKHRKVNALGSKDMQDIRDLIAEVERLTTEVTRYKNVILDDWIGSTDSYGDHLICRYCNATVHRQWKPERKDECTHEDDCVFLLASVSGREGS